MKYRDLIAVICLVALVMVAWSQTEQAPTPTSSPSPKATVSAEAPQKLKTVKKSPEPERKEHRFSRVPEPTVTLEIVSLGDNLNELTLQAKLTAKSETTLNMASGYPTHQFSISTPEQTWNFEPQRPRYAKSRTLKKGESIEWMTRPGQLKTSKDFQGLEAIYGKQPLKISILLTDGDAEGNIYSRRLVRTFGQTITIPAFKDKS